MPPERCYVTLSGVLTQVRTSGKPEETCSGVWGYPHIGNFEKGQKFLLLGVPAQVGTSDTPSKKPYSDLAF
jgi:hypothetical protein